MTQLNIYTTEFFDHLDKTSRILWENKRYTDAAEMIMIGTKYAKGSVCDTLLSNARMCYFHGNDISNAIKCLEKQEELNISNGWELQRDKSNYLRYLNRYDEAYKIAHNLPNNSTKKLALSWFLHKDEKIKEAFSIAEEGRDNVYWWGERTELKLPLWNKEYSENIVIAGESGSGDEIIFARWIPEIKKYCKNLYYYTNSSLRDVFIRNYDLKPYNNEKENCVFIPIMSLPYLLGVDDTGPTSYISCNQSKLDNYNSRFPKTKKRIGLCFHGEKTHIESNLRTLPHFELINHLKDLGELINLQKDYDEIYPNLRYYPFDSWEDTFALIDTCDLIVTCDTSIAHAASCLGKTVIVLLHAAAYFTWNHNVDIGKTKWYKNAWCIRQTEPCKWEGGMLKCKELAIELLEENL